MSFMQQQITTKRTWLILDGVNGVVAVDTEDVSRHELAIAESIAGDGNADTADITTHFGDYYQGEIYSVEIRAGYGARLSAPGYMDCTEWVVFDSVEDAQAYLDDTYGSDEDED